MLLPRMLCLLACLAMLLILPPALLAQQAKPDCGPDHAILYKRAVSLLDQAEKKMAGRYTAEAKALVKEANNLFSILTKECGPTQKERQLTDQEMQQESINKKLAADTLGKAESLEESAKAKEKQSDQAEAKGQKELSVDLQRKAKAEYEQAHVLFIKSQIHALRTQQVIFRFLAP
ncbi:MAG: hypothetical protein FJ128_07295 [Deltaproteobacteria bacterium]|nr:hypothetical protein [Deltaproteobacteria bacterium]